MADRGAVADNGFCRHRGTLQELFRRRSPRMGTDRHMIDRLLIDTIDKSLCLS
ncbi:MAG: hypothetical protein M3Z96_03075 [Pseudomonadota bacterium]|nr:hypothetical protein [Pseudomonadota bacterium]